jgi:hypothetical protein
MMSHLHLCILVSIFILTRYVYTQDLPSPAHYQEYDGYGPILAINEHVAILAQNDKSHFTIIRNPYMPESTWNCTMSYTKIVHAPDLYTFFVYNVAIGAKQNSSHLVFAYLEETWRREVFLTVVFLQDTATGCVQFKRHLTTNLTTLTREECLVGIDPYGTRAYMVGSMFMAYIDLQTEKTEIFYYQDVYNLVSADFRKLYPKAITVTEDHHVFIIGQRHIDFQEIPYLAIVNFNHMPPKHVSDTKLSTFDYGYESMDMTRLTGMSIALDEYSRRILIGLPRLDTILYLSYNETHIPVIVEEHTSNQTGILFGKSVVFLDNNTYAILAYGLPTLPWSISQIQVRLNYIRFYLRKLEIIYSSAFFFSE